VAERVPGSLLVAHPKADVVRVRHWVREFATAAAMPDMLEDFDKVLARQRIKLDPEP